MGIGSALIGIGAGAARACGEERNTSNTSTTEKIRTTAGLSQPESISKHKDKYISAYSNLSGLGSAATETEDPAETAAASLRSARDLDFSKELTAATAADILLSFLLRGFSLTSKDAFLPLPPQLNAILPSEIAFFILPVGLMIYWSN